MKGQGGGLAAMLYLAPGAFAFAEHIQTARISRRLELPAPRWTPWRFYKSGGKRTGYVTETIKKEDMDAWTRPVRREEARTELGGDEIHTRVCTNPLEHDGNPGSNPRFIIGFQSNLCVLVSHPPKLCAGLAGITPRIGG